MSSSWSTHLQPAWTCYTQDSRCGDICIQGARMCPKEHFVENQKWDGLHWYVLSFCQRAIWIHFGNYHGITAKHIIPCEASCNRFLWKLTVRRLPFPGGATWAPSWPRLSRKLTDWCSVMKVISPLDELCALPVSLVLFFLFPFLYQFPDPMSQGTSGNVWKQFWLSWLVGVLGLNGGNQGCCSRPIAPGQLLSASISAGPSWETGSELADTQPPWEAWVGKVGVLHGWRTVPGGGCRGVRVETQA